MKRLITISTLLILPFVSMGQKMDSVQFENLYGNITRIYSKNIEPYLMKLAETEVSPASDNASEDVKFARRTTIEAKAKAHKAVLLGLFSDIDKVLVKDLSRLSSEPKSYISGYLDMAIRTQFPKLDDRFYSDNWKEIFKLQIQH